MNKSQQASLIKLLAVITAAPRWVGALLASEGFVIPENWQWWWIIGSAFLSLAMAGVEGWAFAFIFSAWRNQRDEGAKSLLTLALLAAIVFIIVLTPFIVAQVQGQTLAVTLAPQPWAIWLWGAAVAASTIVIVAGVGFAQKETQDITAISQEQWDSLQSHARGIAIELTGVREKLEQAQTGVGQIDELRAWIKKLQSFGVDTKQGVVATCAFAHNGKTPSQKVLATATQTSLSTVRYGIERAMAQNASEPLAAAMRALTPAGNTLGGGTRSDWEKVRDSGEYSDELAGYAKLLLGTLQEDIEGWRRDNAI